MYKLILTLSAAVLTPACSITKRVTVTSTPAGAVVTASDRIIGTTPFVGSTDNLFPNRYWDARFATHDSLKFRKSGYDDHYFPISEWTLPSKIHVILNRDVPR